ncbi:cobalt-precorrin-5B (C(1))-methyltransferase [Desulfopila sp. IMCC35006]|uniref:cobalt-precorrin-5B (C(1))-methyltransferase CbiD n=1 Tax=Desulfopila sp. IMCC35006 TaxID=2569542 RepID=UPI0010ABA912|nr:cobalt-precorrin-5B (C(1))-methyltransferase CbiD [Desulfopila sp. IMCC35006]TKB26615.1 cobalt-precorrin-5B (C(1))-methyltransferase [Desulfopila sp. IMCC35006]
MTMAVKRLRSGFTTGTCAAAAAKAAAFALMQGVCPENIEIPFPDGSRKSFAVHRCTRSDGSATASIIKDAGDDPDVTNGAEIEATVYADHQPADPVRSVLLGNILLCGGKGIGTVTKPGLAIAVGQPAINPVPRQMIVAAVKEIAVDQKITVTISVPNGAELAEKTLNKRLGILDGISILGTTGIVRPISADAWTATIKASLDVAREAGLLDVVLSTGRTSEKGAQQLLDLPEEAYAMMGDYLEFSLKEAAIRNFKTIHLSGMWAKIMKAALRVPQTHVRNGALEVAEGAQLLAQLGAEGDLLQKIETSNTAREMYSHIEAAGQNQLVTAVCLKARQYCQDVTGTEVKVYLVNHKAEIITHV